MSAGRLRTLSAMTALAAALFVGLMGVAMLLYPGGTWFDRNTVGHAFFSNFFCDLVAHRALNGAPNPVGSKLALTAMLLLVGGMFPFWRVLAELTPERARLGRAVRVLGTLGAALLLAVPLVTSERFGSYHGWMVFAAGLPNFAALVTSLVLLERGTSSRRGLARLGELLFAVALTAFVWHSYHAWRGELGSVMVPVLQKIAAALLVIWVAAVVASAWRAAAPGARRHD